MPVSAIRVWDPLVRIVHWSVACLVVVDLLNEAGANPWHRWFGYAAGALVAARLAWGLFGSAQARLAAMADSARRVLPYVVQLASRAGPGRYIGHNPLGAWMAFALWGLIVLVVVTGWILQLDAFWGDDTVQALHATIAYVLAACVVVHVSGVLATSVLDRTNLVKAMITGCRTPGGRTP